MKRVLNLLLIILLVLLPINVLAMDSVTLTVNEENVPFSSEMGFPFISPENRTMVPVKVISENMNYQVDWDNDTKVVSMFNGINNISIQIGSSKAIVNGVEVFVDNQQTTSSSISAQIYNGRTYVPLRFITESMGGQIEYAKENNIHKINIKNDGQTKVVPIPAPEPVEILKTYTFPEIKGAKVVFNGKVLTVENYGEHNIIGLVKESTKHYYQLLRDVEEIALLEGSGSYTITMFEQIEGTRYRVKDKVTKVIELSKSYDPFLASAQPVYWGDAELNLSNKIIEGAKTDDEKIRLIHSYITKNIKYDHYFAEEIIIIPNPAYYPENEKTLRTKKGICYDYAALFAGLLRSQEIPTKLVKGYRVGDPILHAWNQVYVNGEWKSVDTTYDASIPNKNVYTPSSLFEIKSMY